MWRWNKGSRVCLVETKGLSKQQYGWILSELKSSFLKMLGFCLQVCCVIMMTFFEICIVEFSNLNWGKTVIIAVWSGLLPPVENPSLHWIDIKINWGHETGHAKVSGPFKLWQLFCSQASSFEEIFWHKVIHEIFTAIWSNVIIKDRKVSERKHLKEG